MTGYFNNNGNDTAAGTIAAPWKTLAKLQAAILAGTISTALLAGGQTFNDQPLVFNNVSNVTIGTYGVGLATVSGDVQIPAATWSYNSSNGFWQAPIPFTLASGTPVPRQLYYNSGSGFQRCTRAVNTSTGAFSTNTSTGFTNSGGFGYLTSSSKNQGDLEVVINSANTNQWAFQRLPVSSVGSTTITMASGPWAILNVYGAGWTGGAANVAWIENDYSTFVAAKTPGTHYIDRAAAEIYCYIPVGAVSPNSPTVTVTVPTVEQVAAFNGCNGLTVTGIQFSRTTSLVPGNTTHGFVEFQGGMYFQSTAAVALNPSPQKLTPAVLVMNCSNGKITGNVFSQIGSAALSVEGASSNIEINGNLHFDISGPGEYTGDYGQQTVGALPNAINCHSNAYRFVGQEFPGSPALMAFFANNSRWANLDVRHCPWIGISLGMGWQTSAAIGQNINNSASGFLIADYAQTVNDTAALYLNGSFGVAGQPTTFLQVSNCVFVNGGGNPNGSASGFVSGLYLDNGHTGINVAAGSVSLSVNGSSSAQIHLNAAGDPGGEVRNVSVGAMTVDIGGVYIYPSQQGTETVATPNQVGSAAAIAAAKYQISNGLAGLEPQYAGILGNIPSGSAFESSLLTALQYNATLLADWSLTDPYVASPGLEQSVDLTGGGNTLSTNASAGIIFGMAGGLPADPASTSVYNSQQSGGILGGAAAGSFNANLNIASGSNFVMYTFVRMFAPISAGNLPIILCHSDLSTNGVFVQWANVSVNTINVIVPGSGNAISGVTVPLSLFNGNWHLISIARDSGYYSLRFDGVLLATAGTAYALAIGGSGNANFAGYLLPGQLSRQRIINFGSAGTPGQSFYGILLAQAKMLPPFNPAGLLVSSGVTASGGKGIINGGQL